MSSGVTKSLRGHLIWAFVVIAGLAGGLGTAAALVEISGAVIAPGNIVVETNLKRVQHQEGGIVEAIHVGEGQPVEAGDLLVVSWGSTWGAVMAPFSAGWRKTRTSTPGASKSAPLR